MNRSDDKSKEIKRAVLNICAQEDIYATFASFLLFLLYCYVNKFHFTWNMINFKEKISDYSISMVLFLFLFPLFHIYLAFDFIAVAYCLLSLQYNLLSFNTRHVELYKSFNQINLRLYPLYKRKLVFRVLVEFWMFSLPFQHYVIFYHPAYYTFNHLSTFTLIFLFTRFVNTSIRLCW